VWYNIYTNREEDTPMTFTKEIVIDQLDLEKELDKQNIHYNGDVVEMLFLEDEIPCDREKGALKLELALLDEEEELEWLKKNDPETYEEFLCKVQIIHCLQKIFPNEHHIWIELWG
jgi:hypothetical protein